MKASCIGKFVFSFVAVMAFAALAVSSTPAQATVFDGFADEWYVNSLTQFHTLFGSTTTGYNNAGIYQETATGSTPTITQLTSHTTTSYQVVDGEFAQNTTPNASTALALTNWGAFFGLGSGHPVNAWYGPNNSSTTANPYFQYVTGVTGVNLTTDTFTGGTVGTFTLNSIQLGSAPSTASGITIKGLVGGPTGTIVDSVAEPVNTNGAYNTYTLGWTNIDTVEITAPGTQGAIILGQVDLSPSVPTPVPPSLLLLGSGVFGLVGLRKRFTKA